MSLAGKVALVAGATRGAGRGIAVELGAAGATVYVTGRTTRERRSEYDRPETIEETAELVNRAGGEGIAVPADHLVPGEVRALTDRIRVGHGRLDVLVNDIWGGERLVEWDKPVWEHDLANGLRMLHLAIDTHLITAHFALPLLIQRPGGLLVEVTDGTADYNAENYRLSPFYDLSKVAVNRMAWAHAKDLARHEATALSLTPGWLRSEMMLDLFGVTEENWRDATAAEPHFAISETPRFVGRAVAALAADPDRRRWNGQSLSSGGLAKEYGFTDLDGSRPDAMRYMVEVEHAGRSGGTRSHGAPYPIREGENSGTSLRIRARQPSCAGAIPLSCAAIASLATYVYPVNHDLLASHLASPSACRAWMAALRSPPSTAIMPVTRVHERRCRVPG